MFFSCLCQSWLSVSLCLPALRSRSGRSIINGNWAIDRPGKYEGAGTMFTYRRPNEISSTAGESFLAEGPTNEILDVYVSKKNQLEPQESYDGGSLCFFIFLFFFADLRNGVNFESANVERLTVLFWNCCLSLIYCHSDDLPAAKSWCSLWVHCPIWEAREPSATKPQARR